MRNKKFCIPMLLVVVILLLGGLLVIGVFQLTPHIHSAKLCSMINAGDTESAIEYIEKVADVNEYSSPLWLRRLLNMVEDDIDLPLVVACREGDLRVVKALLEHGADPNLYLDRNWSPMEATFISNKPDRLAIAKLLIQYGADVDAYGSHMSGLFHQLLLYSYSSSDTNEELKEQEECVLFLLSSGASPINDNGDTIMHYVCRSNHVDFISTLSTNYGELLDYRNHQNKTPLMWAIVGKSEDAVAFLLTQSVDVKATDINGKSVLDYALESENQHIIDLITVAIDADSNAS